MMKPLLALVLCIPAFILALDVGKPAPNFKLNGHDGKSYSLNNLKGKTVVLEWFNEGCPYVQKHYTSKNMQELQSRYVSDNLVWLTISSSAKGKQGFLADATAAKKIAREWSMKMSAILFDHDGAVGKAYEATTTPHMFIIDAKGILVYQGAIDSNSSAKPETIKDPQTVNYIAQALDALAKGQLIPTPTTKPYGCSVKY